ncbi:MAG TPA: IPT/TIG domain-containing protein, partial [Candidatus Dormibacteraeota bacterium]|nr:IPT/TIG domain-containing protein [Candidatus Dormibacteraeota bacterium]
MNRVAQGNFCVSRGRFLGWPKALIIPLCLLLGWVGEAQAVAQVQVQQSSNIDSSGNTYTSFTATFSEATTSGNAIIVGLTYGNVDPTISASDSEGNTYALAIKTYHPGQRQGCAILYATNIREGARTDVTVSFSSPVAYLALSIHEYSGILASSALDATAGATGNGSSLSSGFGTTTANGDLIFGCGVEDTQGSGDIFTAGSGFTKRTDLGYAAGYADEDEVESAAGPLAVTWNLSPAASWIADMAAFKSSGTQVSPAPSITSLSPTAGPEGTSVTIAGANFGVTQRMGTVTFNGTPATPIHWSDTTIEATVPSGATTGNVVVTASGVTSNGISFTITPGSAVAKPVLIQSKSDASTSASNAVTTYKVSLVNPAKVGNCLVAIVSWGNFRNQNVGITDDG